MFDSETNLIVQYESIRAAERELNLDKRYIEHYIYLNQTSPVLGRYTFELVGEVPSQESQPIQKTAKKVSVTDVLNEETIIYSSISKAARALGIRQTGITQYLRNRQVKPHKGQYTFSLVEEPSKDSIDNSNVSTGPLGTSNNVNDNNSDNTSEGPN